LAPTASQSEADEHVTDVSELTVRMVLVVQTAPPFRVEATNPPVGSVPTATQSPAAPHDTDDNGKGAGASDCAVHFEPESEEVAMAGVVPM